MCLSLQLVCDYNWFVSVDGHADITSLISTNTNSATPGIVMYIVNIVKILFEISEGRKILCRPL